MLKRKDLLDIKSLSEDEILAILHTAKDMKNKIENSSLRSNELKNKSILTLFYENSTRTKMSFMLAADYLGAKPEDLGISTSSVNKGESLIDTGVTLDQMGIDAIIIRHSFTGASHLLAKNVKACVINAGDGSNEHPTQALLDMYSIIEEKGKIEGLNIAIIGDIANSRVARSNVFALTKLGANVTLAGPSTLVSKNMETLDKNVKVVNNIQEGIKNADVIMGLRVQFERQKTVPFPNNREYHQFFGLKEDMLKYAKDNATIMHPGPVNRGVELSTSIIDSKNCIINEQVKNGVAIRMAILKLLLENR
ncbi:aspartate carbamoyltransferase catalytic subunit [[Clostridium] colinum]|uniref:aspartate carbamoyltransferase catalytic subunit n=1 Tax=[Clostridium] colinum TaxID=36835 RepID=UPI00202491E0|nr:aspartate carbamoyltransferase catalytic subunit [[Clostridium] colinum]